MTTSKSRRRYVTARGSAALIAARIALGSPSCIEPGARQICSSRAQRSRVSSVCTQPSPIGWGRPRSRRSLVRRLLPALAFEGAGLTCHPGLEIVPHDTVERLEASTFARNVLLNQQLNRLALIDRALHFQAAERTAQHSLGQDELEVLRIADALPHALDREHPLPYVHLVVQSFLVVLSVYRAACAWDMKL